jgi:uncharacterized membrane protein YccF (DUF307 family)
VSGFFDSQHPLHLLGERPMNMSFHEKSLWLTLVGLLVAFGWYFLEVLPAASADLLPSQVSAFVLAVAFLVITEVVGHVVIATVDRRPESDERDRLIHLHGVRNGAYVLAAGVFLSLCTAVLTHGNFDFANVLLGSWVLSQVVETGSQLALHRRGA